MNTALSKALFASVALTLGCPHLTFAQAVKVSPHRIAKTINDMIPGESAWTVPWAICVDADRTAWLYPGLTVDSFGPFGTVQVKITKTKDGKGFTAELHDDPDWKFSISDRPCAHTYPVVEMSGF